MNIQISKYCILIFLLIFLSSCTKDNSDDQEENNQDPEKETWVLISKERQSDSTVDKFILTEEDPYPITLIFTTENEFGGHHDPNIYLGTYSIDTIENSISFSGRPETDGSSFWPYWEYVADLGKIIHYEMIGTDTLKLSDQDTLSYLLLRKGCDELTQYYPNFNCLKDILNIENLLQGSTWIVWCKQIVKQQPTTELLLPATEDEFPVTLTLVGQDSLYGRHTNNSYSGSFVREGAAIDLFNITSTEFQDNQWYWEYIQELEQMTTNEVVGLYNDTLKLSNNDKSLSLYFLSKSFFNETHFNIDSLYSN